MQHDIKSQVSQFNDIHWQIEYEKDGHWWALGIGHDIDKLWI